MFKTSSKRIISIISEKKLFQLMILLNMLPVLLFRFFPTMDGPAHLYNSNIISELLFNSHSTLNNYFAINPEPVPNWLSHFILALTNLFLPAWVAEKVLLILYFVLLPLSFRSFVKIYNKPVLSYIIFPFTYSFLFYIGFYNYCLAFILLFYTISYWLKQKNEKNILRMSVVLFLLISITYFAHLLVYAFLLFSIFTLALQEVWETYQNKRSIKKVVKTHFKQIATLFFASLPSLLLFLWFFLKRDFSGENEYLDNSELIKWIKDIRPIIALSYEPELRLTEVLYHLFVGLTAILFFQRIQQIDYKQDQSIWQKIIHTTKNGLFLKKDIFLLISLVVLLVYFYYPNSGGAGMMSDRFALMFYIFFIAWLAIQKFPKWLNIISVVVIIGINLGFVYRYLLATKDLNNFVTPIYKVADYIEPNSTVIPINFSDNWLSLHFSNYMGADKPMVVLENYEADVGWFPIRWKPKIPNNTIGGLKKDSTCVYWVHSNNMEQSADYVFILGEKPDKRECESTINEMLEKYYQRVKIPDNYNMKLFKKK